MCSILTKGSTCRKNKKMRFSLILIEQVGHDKFVEKKLALFTKLWSIYELHIYIILIIILNIII